MQTLAKLGTLGFMVHEHGGDVQVINTRFDWESRKLAHDLLENVDFTTCRISHVDRQVTVEGDHLLDPQTLREMADRLGVRHVELDGTPLVWEH